MADRQGLACLIAAGGTAGHVLPSIAVGEALRARGATVTFAGSPDRVEARLVPEAGFEFDAFSIAGLPRKPGLELARSLVRAGGAIRSCRGILRRRRADVVLGAGSFVAGPMVIAAASLRIPAALTEADAHLGLANRLAAPFARRVFLAYETDGLGPPKYRVVGRPIPASSRAILAPSEARRRFGLGPPPVLLIFGGSQGARRLNEEMVARWGAAGPSVLHISGRRDYEALLSRVERPDYRLVPFTEDFGAALAAADLVVARAGGAVWEIAAAGKPAVLVPYPHATSDHQMKNARYFEQHGAAVVVPEDEPWELDVAVEGLLADEPRRYSMAEAMRRLAKPDAADRIAEELIALAAARR